MDGPSRALLDPLIALLMGALLGAAAMRLVTVQTIAPAVSAQAQTAFAVNYKPIHPAVIQALMTPMEAATPFVRAVDVSAFAENDAFERTSQLGVMTAHRLDAKRARTGEFIAYTHVGVLPGGVHVLDVSECSGGSGIFRSLLLVRLNEASEGDLNRGRPKTLVLSSVDQIALGDRNNAIVSVEGEGVVVQGALEGGRSVSRGQRPDLSRSRTESAAGQAPQSPNRPDSAGFLANPPRRARTRRPLTKRPRRGAGSEGNSPIGTGSNANCGLGRAAFESRSRVNRPKSG